MADQDAREGERIDRRLKQGIGGGGHATTYPRRWLESKRRLGAGDAGRTLKATLRLKIALCPPRDRVASTDFNSAVGSHPRRCAEQAVGGLLPAMVALSRRN
jgi:hypothetical protein